MPSFPSVLFPGFLSPSLAFSSIYNSFDTQYTPFFLLSYEVLDSKGQRGLKRQLYISKRISGGTRKKWHFVLAGASRVIP